MTVLVACETVLLILVILLMAGLLRSHAEILRRLGPEGDRPPDTMPPDSGAPLPEPPSRPLAVSVTAPRDITGTTLEGDAVKIALGPAAPATLVAFLTSGCGVCANFWEGLRGGRPADLGDRDLRLVVVTKDTSHESPSRLADLRPAAVPLIMSSAAWQELRVPAAPYFVFVDAGVVRGEGSATTWGQIASLLRDAEHDERSFDGETRTDAIDAVLEAAGIGAGHPSLYPAGKEEPREGRG